MKNLIHRWLDWRRHFTHGETGIFVVLLLILGSIWLIFIVTHP